MNIRTDHSEKNRNQTPINHSAGHSGMNGQSHVDMRPEAVTQRMLQDIADNSPQVSQLKALQQMADKQGVVQRFKIGGSKEYKGYLAGDHVLRSPGNVPKIIDLLKQKKPVKFREPMTAAKDLEMVKEKDESKGWQYISKSEYDEKKIEGAEEPEVEKKNVLFDGHHRFVAYAELDLDLPDIKTADEGLVNQGYHWDKVENIS